MPLRSLIKTDQKRILKNGDKGKNKVSRHRRENSFEIERVSLLMFHRGAYRRYTTAHSSLQKEGKLISL